jgi:hypothetical protein
MNEPFFLAMLFAILAFAGVEPGHAQVAKVCRLDSVVQFWGGC